jgi:hypothetical protein
MQEQINHKDIRSEPNKAMIRRERGYAESILTIRRESSLVFQLKFLFGSTKTRGRQRVEMTTQKRGNKNFISSQGEGFIAVTTRTRHIL